MIDHHDAAVAHVSPEQVWPYVADPGLIPFWNEKLVKVTRSIHGTVQTGEVFEARYRMSRSGGVSRVMVTRCQPMELVEYHHAVTSFGKQAEVVERYELTPHASGCRVRQTIELGPGTIPWWAVPIVWLLARFGRPRGMSAMEKLAELAEREAARSGASDPGGS